MSLLIFFIGSLSAQEINYQKIKIEGVWVHVITVNLNSPNVSVRPVLAKRNNGLKNPAEYFRQFVSRLLPRAMINGTFHDTKTYSLAGTLVLNGSIKSFYRRGVAIIFHPDNRVEFVPAKTLNPKHLSGLDVLTAGPTLLLRGQVRLNPRSEGFGDIALYRPARRAAVGKTANNKLKLVAVNHPITLRKLARIMNLIHCKDAISLDGGGSTGLYYSGKILAVPRRPITNVLVVYEKKREAGAVQPQKVY